MGNPVLSGYADDPALGPWVPVKSTNVAAVKYVSAFATPYLFVRFKSGERYAYHGVPRGVYEGLLSAPSKGQYVYYVIRGKGTDSVYPYDKL